jgi:hypothetical protein
MTRSIKKWSDEAKLQDCFVSTDWNMFWDSSTSGVHHISHWLYQ